MSELNANAAVTPARIIYVRDDGDFDAYGDDVVPSHMEILSPLISIFLTVIFVTIAVYFTLWWFGIFGFLFFIVFISFVMRDRRRWHRMYMRHVENPELIARDQTLDTFRKMTDQQVIERMQMFMDREQITFQEALRRMHIIDADYRYFTTRKRRNAY